jgi:hypothetical protein
VSRAPDLVLLRRMADWLDSRFRIPGTRIRFGIDPLLSLIPGLGDLASPAYTVFLLAHGLYLRVPRIVMIRMVFNALVDAVLGIIPGVGTVMDVFWRANVANLALVERHARPGRPPERGDYLFVWAVIAVFGLLVFIPMVLAIWVMVLIGRQVF